MLFLDSRHGQAAKSALRSPLRFLSFLSLGAALFLNAAQVDAHEEAADADAAIASPTDEPPHSVRRHYMWSNERSHELWFADLHELGGGYLGVGGDQNYTLAAAAGSTALWLVDLDSAVVYMHRLYAALIASAATPGELVKLFERRSIDAAHAAVLARYSDAGERRAILEVYHTYREDLHEHLRAQAHARSGRTWLSDASKYQHIRDLVQHGRLVARLGDLTGPRTMLEIATAAQRAAIPVHAVYLSNAESWFRYGPEFRKNLSTLPFDEKSVILRTVKSEVLGYPASDIWHYSVQRAQNFADNLGHPAYYRVDVAMTDAVLAKKKGLSHIGFPLERGAKPLLAKNDPAGKRRDARRSLIASGLVTRPEGNRERATEMDRDRRRRAAIELARIGVP